MNSLQEELYDMLDMWYDEQKKAQKLLEKSKTDSDFKHAHDMMRLSNVAVAQLEYLFENYTDNRTTSRKAIVRKPVKKAVKKTCRRT